MGMYGWIKSKAGLNQSAGTIEPKALTLINLIPAFIFNWILTEINPLKTLRKSMTLQSYFPFIHNFTSVKLLSNQPFDFNSKKTQLYQTAQTEGLHSNKLCRALLLFLATAAYFSKACFYWRCSYENQPLESRQPALPCQPIQAEPAF